jgi:hypothetical protein
MYTAVKQPLQGLLVQIESDLHVCCPIVLFCSRHPEILDAVAALARHVCLKAPDKADCRTAAVKAASELLADLPQWEQEQFTGCVYNLSRTQKVCSTFKDWCMVALAFSYWVCRQSRKWLFLFS